MSQYGPGDRPPVVRRRAVRARRKDRPKQQPSSTARQNAAFGSRPARPLPKPAPAPTPRPARASSAPHGDTKADVRAGESFKQTARYRGAVVGAYTSLSVHERKQRVRQAVARAKRGTATEADRAVLHAHRTRVAGNRKRADAVRAFNALGGAATPDTAPRLKVKVRKAGAGDGFGAKIAGAIRAVGKASSEGYKSVHAPKVLQNAPVDIAELAVTTPTSLAKLASDVVTHPKRVPGELAAPYVELAKHPKEFFTERPVSTVLMVAPAGRLPGRAAGRVARAAGKQTLERPAAAYPGTVLREKRTGSKDYVVRRRQARADRRNPEPVMTDKQLDRRVDEFADARRQHISRAERSAAKRAEQRGLTGDAAREFVEGARAGARQHTDRRFAEEFGTGTLHTTRANAEAGAAAAPFDAAVREVGKGDKTAFVVVPARAAERLRRHGSVGSSKSMGSKVMRTGNRLFTGAVLPVSPKWLMGQGAEAGFRSAVAGAGPTSFLREARVFRKLEAERPGAGHEFRARTSGGGQFGLTGPAREFAENRRSLADEFEDTALERPAKAATKVGALPGLRHIRAGYRDYTSFVFSTVNGALEGTARRAMTGKALKDSPLMERHVLGLTDRAIAEAAAGARATETQVALGRAVDRMYGAYTKFSPDRRETLMHTTPFYPWYRNTAEFLLRTLPVDHPVHAAVLADLDAATEDWRKAHGLSLRGGDTVPDFLLGRYPVKGGGSIPVGRYLPFAPKDLSGAAADLVLPAFSGTLQNLRGVEWTGEKLKGRPIPSAALTTAETFTPGLAQVDRVTGVSRAVRKAGRKGIAQGVRAGRAVREEVDPFVANRPQSRKPKARRKSGGPGNPLLLSGGGLQLK